MNIRYTPEALRDLLEMKEYIRVTLQNPKAADRITKEILDSCGQLKQFPEMGMSLDARTGANTGLRCLRCGKRIAFYRIDGDTVSVARILDGRQDYLRIQFGDGE